MSTVTATLAGHEQARPPIDRLLVDVTLHNTDSAARWFLVPSRVPVQAAGGVDKLEQLTAQAASGSVAIGRLLGTGGRYAVRLAAGAKVTLRGLPINWWREDPSGAKQIALAVEIASEVKAGKESLASWFSGDPTIAGAVDAAATKAAHTASHRAPDDAEQPLATTGARTETISLAVP